MQMTQKAALMEAIDRAERHNAEEAMVRRQLKDTISNESGARSDHITSLLGSAREELRTILYNQAMADWRNDR
jgi:hypothetical protein